MKTGHFETDRRERHLDKIITTSLFVLVGLFTVISLINIVDPHLFWSHFERVNLPLHSTIEAVGAIIAIFMAFMSIEFLAGKINHSYLFISLGFLSMGLFDLFHSVVPIGNGFVLSHSLALLSGGLFFFLSIFPWGESVKANKNLLLFLVAFFTILFSIFMILFESNLPQMIAEHGFSHTAIILNMISGFLFLIATIKIFYDYTKHKTVGIAVLFFVCAISSIAGFTFGLYHAWSDSWWFWHLLRIISFVAVLAFMLRSFLRVVKERAIVLTEVEQTNKQLIENEQAILQQQQLTDSIIDSLPGIFYQINKEGFYTRWNKRFLEITGFTNKEMKLINAVEFFKGEDAQNVATAMGKVFTEGEASVEAGLVIKSGESIPTLFSGAKFEIEGEPYILGMGLNITEIRKVQEKMKKVNNELQTFNKMAVGREKQMISLKEIINSLSRELGKDEPYDLAFAELNDSEDKG